MSKLLIKSKSKSKLSSPSSLSCLTTMKSVIIESNISDQQQQHQQQQQSIIKNIQSISSISRSGSVSVNGKSSSLITLKTSSSSETIVETYLRRKHLEPLEIIGEGGFSTVYKVRHLKNNKMNDDNDSNHIYAAKVIRLNESNRLWVTKCLKHEMYISKSLHHTNIVRTHDYFKTNTYAVILMEYYTNGNIRQEIDKQNHPYNITEAVRLFNGLIAGLQYMHGKNIAHRDLKLDNFFLDNDRQPLIGDFGFATIGTRQGRMIIEHLIRQTRCGSEGYMAPEVARITGNKNNNNNDDNNNEPQQYNAKKADVYSMGVCLYEMLHQTLPNIDTATTTTTGSPSTPLSSLSFAHNINQRWQNLIKSMLNIEPNERPSVEDIFYQISSPLFSFIFMGQRSSSKTGKSNEQQQNEEKQKEEQQPQKQQRKHSMSKKRIN
ncbi:protein kinase-like protein [Dermatophagoides farinae]|nr:protein kinase-like protein [Dermatophagoides farinae]